MCWRTVLRAFLLCSALAGCAAPPPIETEGVDVLLLGERHDDPAHQRAHRDVVRMLASQGRLAALVLEMAPRGGSTAALPPDADEAAVRAPLHWDGEGWPWAAYAPAIMEAVRARVPVLGGNLQRDALRPAMGNAELDALLDAGALQQQREAIRSGHCGLLPESQLGPMARVQVARDESLARTIAAAAVPGKVVVLLAGAGHVDPTVGVPRHLPPTLLARSRVWPPSGEAPAVDHCAVLREQMRQRPVG